MGHKERCIRRAGRADLPLLLELVAEFYRLDGHPFDESHVRNALVPLLEDSRFGLVWMLGELPCGYAVITWGYSLESGGRDALLDEIYLRERRRGLGSRALKQIVEDLRKRGLRRVFLETEKPNQAVRRFYSRHGFIEEPSTWMSLDLEVH